MDTFKVLYIINGTGNRLKTNLLNFSRVDLMIRQPFIICLRVFGIGFITVSEAGYEPSSRLPDSYRRRPNKDYIDITQFLNLDRGHSHIVQLNGEFYQCK